MCTKRMGTVRGIYVNKQRGHFLLQFLVLMTSPFKFSTFSSTLSCFFRVCFSCLGSHSHLALKNLCRKSAVCLYFPPRVVFAQFFFLLCVTKKPKILRPRCVFVHGRKIRWRCALRFNPKSIPKLPKYARQKMTLFRLSETALKVVTVTRRGGSTLPKSRSTTSDVIRTTLRGLNAPPLR